MPSAQQPATPSPCPSPAIVPPSRLLLAIAASLTMIGSAGAVEVYKSKGMEWTRVTEQTMNHAEASAYCAGKINGQGGWRLPTLREAEEGRRGGATGTGSGSGSEYDFRNAVGPADKNLANQVEFWTSLPGNEAGNHWTSRFVSGMSAGYALSDGLKLGVVCARPDAAGAKPAAKTATPKAAAGSSARAADTKLPGATSTYEADANKRDAQARADKKASDVKAVTDKAQAGQQLSTEQAAARAAAKARADKAAPCVKDGTGACNVSK